MNELKKVAARSGENGHAYATDEDTRGIDPDPFTNRFDLGSDPIAFAKRGGGADAGLRGARGGRRPPPR